MAYLQHRLRPCQLLPVLILQERYIGARSERQPLQVLGDHQKLLDGVGVSSGVTKPFKSSQTGVLQTNACYGQLVSCLALKYISPLQEVWEVYLHTGIRNSPSARLSRSLPWSPVGLVARWRRKAVAQIHTLSPNPQHRGCP